MSKNILVGVLVVIALLLGLNLGGDKLVPASAPQLGALSGPDIQSPWLRVGGVQHEYRSKDLVTATSTVCSLQAPSATSTLTFASVNISTGTTTALTFVLGSATTAFATSTLIGAETWALGSGVTGALTHLATSSIATGNTKIPPNYFVNWRVNGLGASLTSDKLLGSCEAIFIVN